MRGRFIVYAISVITIFVAILLFLLGLFGILNPTTKQITGEFDKLLDNHTENIRQEIDELAACAISFSEQMENELQNFLSDNNLDFEQLKNNPEALENLQDKLYNTVYLNMQVAHPSGAFYILDTTINTKSDENYRNGVYLKYINLFSANTVNNDFSLFRGSYTTGHSKNINFHSGWQNECKTDFFENSDLLFPEGVHYALSPTVVIPDTWERARYVYVPIRSIKGEILGVCGFEMSDLLFRLSHKPDDSKLGYVVCGLLDEKTGVYSGQFNSDIYKIPEKGKGNFSISKKGELNHFVFGNDICVGRLREISLGNDKFSVAVMLPKPTYDKLIRNGQLNFAYIFLIIAILALCYCIFMSKTYISPVIRKIEQLKSKEKYENSQKIAEIDDLFVFLEERDLYIEAQMKNLEESQKSAEEEAEKAKNAYDAAMKEYRLAQIEIHRLSESWQGEIVAEDYEYFIGNLDTLTDAERRIYELYLEGKKAAEISQTLGISPNTLKFHNKNIYSKLGISSRKQLLKYAVLKQYQDNKTSDSENGTNNTNTP